MSSVATPLVRPIELQDKEEWVKLFSGPNSYLEFYKSTLTAEVIDSTFARFFDDSIPVYALVAVDPATSKLIGLANYLVHYSTWNIEQICYINDLFVSEDSRLHGTGRTLMEAVFDWAKERKLGKVYWSTQTHNHRAQLLYTKVGKNEDRSKYRWCKDGETPDFYC